MAPTTCHTFRLLPVYFDVDETASSVNKTAIWSKVNLVACVFTCKYDDDGSTSCSCVIENTYCVNTLERFHYFRVHGRLYEATPYTERYQKYTYTWLYVPPATERNTIYYHILYVYNLSHSYLFSMIVDGWLYYTSRFSLFAYTTLIWRTSVVLLNIIRNVHWS